MGVASHVENLIANKSVFRPRLSLPWHPATPEAPVCTPEYGARKQRPSAQSFRVHKSCLSARGQALQRPAFCDGEGLDRGQWAGPGAWRPLLLLPLPQANLWAGTHGQKRSHLTPEGCRGPGSCAPGRNVSGLPPGHWMDPAPKFPALERAAVSGLVAKVAGKLPWGPLEGPLRVCSLLPASSFCPRLAPCFPAAMRGLLREGRESPSPGSRPELAGGGAGVQSCACP